MNSILSLSSFWAFKTYKSQNRKPFSIFVFWIIYDPIRQQTESFRLMSLQWWSLKLIALITRLESIWRMSEKWLLMMLKTKVFLVPKIQWYGCHTWALWDGQIHEQSNKGIFGDTETFLSNTVLLSSTNRIETFVSVKIANNKVKIISVPV